MVRRRKANPLVFLLAAVIVIATGWWQQRSAGVAPAVAPAPAPAAQARSQPSAAERSPGRTSRLAQIPQVERAAVERTLQLIEAGGPFPHDQDGAVFQNREGRLPRQARGYYREYTVPTPGASNRGARRVVMGRDGETWYTSDHYDSFVRIDE